MMNVREYECASDGDRNDPAVTQCSVCDNVLTWTGAEYECLECEEYNKLN